MATYIRLAKLPDEMEEMLDVWVRAYARDPTSNYWGVVKNMVSHYDINQVPKGSKDYRTLKRLRTFEAIVMGQAQLLGGAIYVVVEKTADGKEKIVGGATWLPPGTELDPSFTDLVKLKAWKVLFAWGFRGSYRILAEFTPQAEKSKRTAFKARGLDRKDSWQLLAIVVDPSCQGKGYGSLLLEDGLARASSKPAHLEASNERAAALYKRHGFEVDEVHQFGVGKVDANGLPAKGDKAVGISEWMMYKWS